MPHIKDVLSSEVHWQIAGWNVRDQANARVRQIMGEDAVLFAPVYVTHGGYYWSVPDLRGWRMLSDADVATNTSVHRHLDALRRKAIERFPAQESRIEQLFTVPNDDFIFFRTTDNVTEIRLTGWGFSNFKRAIGGQPIRDTEDSKLREITVSFIIDGIRQPDREFELRRPTGWVAMRTDADGIYSFGKQNPGTTIAVRDVSTGIERQVTVDTETGHVDIDVTEYLHLRINARHDGMAINGEHVIFHYGHRGGEAVLEQGVAEFRLPWMQGESCTVSIRDQQQSRKVECGAPNVFNFDFVTARPSATRVEIHVRENGQPVAAETVKVEYLDSVREYGHKNEASNGVNVGRWLN